MKNILALLFTSMLLPTMGACGTVEEGTVEKPETADAQTGEEAVVAEPTAFEMSVIAELNEVRADPKKYAETKLAAYQNPYADSGESFEEVRQECIAEMSGLAALPQLTYARGLWLVARDLVTGQGPTGAIGHERADGSSFVDNVNKYAASYSAVGENVSYGPSEATAIVVQLLVDDDVASRGHRKNILNSSYDQVGVAFGAHALYENMCVMDFAKGWVDKK